MDRRRGVEPLRSASRFVAGVPQQIAGLSDVRHEASSHASSMNQVTTHQVVAWIAAGGGAWMMVRAFVAKGVLKMRAPSHCAACGRKRVDGRCRCTDM